MEEGGVRTQLLINSVQIILDVISRLRVSPLFSPTLFCVVALFLLMKGFIGRRFFRQPSLTNDPAVYVRFICFERV